MGFSRSLMPILWPRLFFAAATLSRVRHIFESFSLMAFGMPPITDFCFLVEDVERSVAFYRDKLGFALRTKAEGFADFKTEHVAFALWEIDHIAKTVGISNKRPEPGVHRSIGAIELKKPDEIDVLYAQLLERGVKFIAPPKDYPWQARCIYFTDPDDYLWEVYAWLEELGGKRFGEVSQ